MMKTANKIGTIIVGVDFSKYSKAVLRQARHMAMGLKVPLVVVHAFEDPIVSEWQYKLVKKEVYGYFEDKIRAYYKIKGGEVFAKRGAPAEKIISIAKLYNNPLILIGHRGDSGIVSKFFIGSTAEKVSLKSPFPVMIYRGQKLKLPHKVLIPTDFSPRTARTLSGLKKFGFKNLELELFHVLPPPPPIFNSEQWEHLQKHLKIANQRELENFRKKFSPIPVVQVNSADVAGKVRVRASKFDMIAISPSPKKGFLGNWGSVTSKTIRSGETPILIIP